MFSKLVLVGIVALAQVGVLGSMIAREFFADEPQGSAESDPSFDDGAGFDTGGFDDV